MKDMDNNVKQKKKITVYDLVVVGLMAAICFVVTYFIKIPITTPVGPTMIKVANAFCLLAGILFGGWRGGLAAGIGSAFYDVLDPLYITSAPITLIRFFLMAFLCGWIAHANGRQGKNFGINIIAAAVGSVFSTFFYIVESIIKQLLLGASIPVAVTAVVPKMITSGINMIIAIVLAVILAPLFRTGLEQAGVYRQLAHKK